MIRRPWSGERVEHDRAGLGDGHGRRRHHRRRPPRCGPPADRRRPGLRPPAAASHGPDQAGTTRVPAPEMVTDRCRDVRTTMDHRPVVDEPLHEQVQVGRAELAPVVPRHDGHGGLSPAAPPAPGRGSRLCELIVRATSRGRSRPAAPARPGSPSSRSAAAAGHGPAGRRAGRAWRRAARPRTACGWSIVYAAAAIAAASVRGMRRLVAQVHQDRRDVDLHRAGVEAGAAERRRVRQGGVVLDPGELRRQHRADRARIDRPVRVPAGPLVDRADVEAGRAADAVQRLPARPRRRAPRCARCPAAPGGSSCGPSPGVTPCHIEVYGFIRSPVDARGSSCRNTSRSDQRGTIFSMPITVISVSGRVRHIRPLPSDSTTASVPVSAIAKFAPDTATRVGRNVSRR